MQVAPKIEQPVPHDHPLGWMNGIPGASSLKRKKIEFRADDFVVPLFSFFEHEKIFFQQLAIGKEIA